MLLKTIKVIELNRLNFFLKLFVVVRNKQTFATKKHVVNFRLYFNKISLCFYQNLTIRVFILSRTELMCVSVNTPWTQAWRTVTHQSRTSLTREHRSPRSHSKPGLTGQKELSRSNRASRHPTGASTLMDYDVI